MVFWHHSQGMKETDGHNITTVHQGLNRPRISLVGSTGRLLDWLQKMITDQTTECESLGIFDRKGSHFQVQPASHMLHMLQLVASCVQEILG